MPVSHFDVAMVCKQLLNPLLSIYRTEHFRQGRSDRV